MRIGNTESVITAQQIGSVLGAAIVFGGYIPYIRGILRGETKPSRVTWIIWIVLDLVTLAGMIATNTVNGQLLAAIAGGSFVAYKAIKGGEGQWALREKLYLAGGVLGLFAWLVTRDPVAAILMSLILVFWGAFPTYESAFNKPHEENLPGWMCGAFGGVPVLATLPKWTIASAAQPLAWTVINGITVLILIYRRYVRPPQSASLTS